MASLIAADGTKIELIEGENLVGRGGREFSDPPKVDVGPLLGGPTVSRHHARIYQKARQWFLRVEPESRNPTFVGDREIPRGEEVPLPDQVPIKLGDVVLTFLAPDSIAARLDQTAVEGNGHASSLVVEVPLPPPVAPPQVSPTPSTPAVPRTPPLESPGASWPARLPPRPSALTAVGVDELKRVNPFRGLMIDDETWADAHNYHLMLARLHLLGGHGWGVVEGLEVIADPSVPNTIVVRPGIAVDVEGQTLLVKQDRRLVVSGPDGATVYVTARSREELAAPQRYWSDQDEYTRVIEKCDVQIQNSPPAAPALELARLTFKGAARDAADPRDPRSGEIDLRFRERLGIRPRPELVVAQLIVADADPQGTIGESHQRGLRYVLREIGLTTAYRPRWAGACRLGDDLPQASLLYVTGTGGFTIAVSSLGQVQRFLAGGGILFADACQSGNAAEFAASVSALASALGQTVQEIRRGHPLLESRHLFSSPPLPGLNGGSDALLGGEGILLTTADYGCAWQGGRAEAPLPRETIRASLELGVDAAVFGRKRQRPLEAVEFEN